ncbi:unnamed protein product [Victoria cruziana]
MVYCPRKRWRAEELEKLVAELNVSFASTRRSMRRNPLLGVCYSYPGTGQHPVSSHGVALVRSLGIRKVRLLHDDQQILERLKNTGIEVSCTLSDFHFQGAGLCSSSAASWVQGYIEPYSMTVNFRYITIRGEANASGDYLWHLVLPAMLNILEALPSRKQEGCIMVTMSVDLNALGNWKRPSDACFQEPLFPFIVPILDFLAKNNWPLMVNFSPYHMYVRKDSEISLDYALIEPGCDDVLVDGPLSYDNIFDATVDAFYWAMEKIGYPRVPIVCSTGWPSAGGVSGVTTTANALAYHQNLVHHLAKGKGTPRRPKTPIEVYLCALFNSERGPYKKLDWSLFDFKFKPVYPLNFPF